MGQGQEDARQMIKDPWLTSLACLGILDACHNPILLFLAGILLAMSIYRLLTNGWR
jgi:hypothetical protein